MFKFAFLINVPEANAENYSTRLENSETITIVEGVDGVEAGVSRIPELIAQGIDHFDLCGDFDDELTAKIRAQAGDGIRIKNSIYSAEELAKLEKLESMYGYGMIIKADGIDETVWRSMKNDDCATTIAFVKDLEQAKAAAIKMAESDVNFIELCSWFDADKTQAVVQSMDGALPVGSCGLK